MKVFFRVDASPEIGIGHLVRCLALADAMASQDVENVFILKEQSAQAQTLLETRNYATVWIGGDLEYSQEEDAQICLAFLERDACLVVDKYDLDIRWEHKVRNSVRRLLVIDDLANRMHDCDSLVDAGYGRLAQDYAGYVPEDANLHLGTEFAMLRTEFAPLHDTAAAWPTLCKAHVFLGGGAASKWLPICVEALLEAHATLRVCAVGPAGDAAMESLLQRHGVRLEWHRQVDKMADAYAQCDVAIGSPGTSTWERACIGLPSAVFATADNQIPILRQLNQREFCRFLGAIWETGRTAMVPMLRDFLSDTTAMQRLRANGVRAVDGQGVRRVMRALLYEGT